MDRLPIILVDGHIVATGVHLSRAQLAQILGLSLGAEDQPRIKADSCCNPIRGCC